MRTLRRDILFMRDRVQLPIEYDSQHHGSFSARPVDSFPPSALTEVEILALALAYRSAAEHD